MTKKVRIENADTSNYNVVVRVFDQGFGGADATLVETKILNNPADLAEVYIHSGRYITVCEE